MSKIGDVSRKRRLGDPVRVRFYGYWRSLRWRSRMTGRPLPPGALDGFCGSQDTPKCTEYQTPLERKPVGLICVQRRRCCPPSADGPHREIPIRVELLRVKDKGFVS